MSDKHKDTYKRNLTLLEKGLYSSFTGLVGCLFGNPADVSLVRFQRDSLLPAELRRNYKNVFDALGRIVKEEGVMALWKGSVPSVCRAIAMNVGMLTTYDQIKEMVNKFEHVEKDTLETQVIASAIAGVVCAFMSLPFDNAKTKLQGMKAVNGVLPYSNVFDCMAKTIKFEGFTGLWVGFSTYIFRVSPHAITALLV